MKSKLAMGASLWVMALMHPAVAQDGKIARRHELPGEERREQTESENCLQHLGGAGIAGLALSGELPHGIQRAVQAIVHR